MESKPVVTTVYVVDDDADVLLSLKFLLETEGFSVRTFRSGQELLESGPPERIDCLIIDYKMPGMDGLDLVRQLRARDVRAPVVLITGYPNAGVEAKAAASGVRHVVLKPHIDESLLAHLSAAMLEEADARSGLRKGP
jgi:two-component system, LuxR family, response regulator FixJ